MRHRKYKARFNKLDLTCYRCEHCEYIGDGDHICKKHEEDPENKQ